MAEGRGLVAYDPQQDPDHRKETDLSRLSRTHGAGFDRAFLKVMTARHRTGLGMAAAEARDGANPELRALARQMTTDLQASSSRCRRCWQPELVHGRARGLGP